MHDIHSAGRRGFMLSSAALALAGVLGSSSGAAFAAQPPARLVITAIPDDGDADRMREHFGALARLLGQATGIPVEYMHVENYAASVTALATGRAHIAWLGAVTTAQARMQMGEALTVLGCRDIDKRFVSYFIANPSDNTSSLSSLTSDHFTYVPRKIGHRYACLHRFHSDMPEQLRGVSILSPAMKLFRDLSDYVDYELVGALIAASFTVFIEAPGDPLGGMGGGLDGKSAAGPTASYPPQLQPGTLTT